MLTRALVLLLACPLLTGCPAEAKSFFFVGPSMTWGTHGTPNVTCAACPSPPGNCGCKEPGGGYPDYIKAAFAGIHHVGNRGIPSFTVPYFIARPDELPQSCTGSGCLETVYWPPYGAAGNPAYPWWTDVPTSTISVGTADVGGYEQVTRGTGDDPLSQTPVAAIDRISNAQGGVANYTQGTHYALVGNAVHWLTGAPPFGSPYYVLYRKQRWPYGDTYAQTAALAGILPASSPVRVCVAMVGVNDWFYHGKETFCGSTHTKCTTAATCDPGVPCMAKSATDYAAVVFERYARLIGSLNAVCKRVVVMTELCGTDPGDGTCPFNTRTRPDGAPDAPYLRAYNDLIRGGTLDAEVLDMDARVVALGGEAFTPFPDTIHPTCPVYRMMAQAVLQGLVDLGITKTLGAALPPCA